MLPRIVPTTVAALGAGALAAGVLMLTVAAPAPELSGATAADGVVVTAPGVLALTGEPVQVQLTGAGDGAFVGVGRPDEVQAWLGDLEHVRVDGLTDEETLAVTAVPGQQLGEDLDPAVAGLWQEEVAGGAEASLTLPEPDGDEVLLAAAPAGTGELTLAWERSVRHPGAWPLVVGGALVAVAAALWLAALNARRRRAVRRGRRA